MGFERVFSAVPEVGSEAEFVALHHHRYSAVPLRAHWEHWRATRVV
jgi:hypothetical protein